MDVNKILIALGLTGEKEVEAGLNRTGRNIGGLADELAALGPKLTAGALAYQFIQANREIEKTRLALTQILGSADAANATLGRLQETANRLGQDAGVLSTSFVSLAASAKGTALEGQATEEIFTAIVGAMAQLGKSSAETDRALIAVAQMMSKGTVSAEELKGQLGEALPGAMQAAARGAGLTVAELQKLMATGTLMAEDMLPGLAAELKRTFNTDAQVDTLDAQFNRLKNQLREVLIVAGDSGAIKGLSLALSGVHLAATEAFAALEVGGKQLGVLAGAIATMDFSRVREEFALIAEEAAIKVGKAANSFVELARGMDASAKSAAGSAAGMVAATEASGAAAASAGALWNRLAADYAAVEKAVTGYTKQAELSIGVAKAQAEVIKHSAELSGVEERAIVAKAQALDLVAKAQQGAADADRTAVEVARAKLAAFEAEAVKLGQLSDAKKKQLADLREEVTTKDLAAQKSAQAAAAAEREAQVARVTAQTYGDQAQQLGQLRAAYESARAAADALAARQSQDAETTAKLAAARDTEAAALNRYRDALQDAAKVQSARMTVMEAEARLAGAQIDVAIQVARNEEQIARAKGDEMAARNANLRAMELEIRQKRILAELAAREAEIIRKKADLIEAEARATGTLTEEKKLEIEAMRLSADLKDTDARAASVAADALRNMARETRRAGEEAGAAADGYDEMAGSLDRVGRSARDATGEINKLASQKPGGVPTMNVDTQRAAAAYGITDEAGIRAFGEALAKETAALQERWQGKQTLANTIGGGGETSYNALYLREMRAVETAAALAGQVAAAQQRELDAARNRTIKNATPTSVIRLTLPGTSDTIDLLAESRDANRLVDQLRRSGAVAAR